MSPAKHREKKNPQVSLGLKNGLVMKFTSKRGS